MRLIDLKLAASEIRQAVEGATKRGRSYPFFFMVGAGVSHPPIPLAAAIQEDCRKVALEYGRTADPPIKQPAGEYSHWFSQAFPQPAQRQEYLRDLMEKTFISRANFRLAHLLLKPSITNLVVTTNFDDFLSRALTLFGKRHILCDHPNTVERIDLQSEEIQILHVHGSYWFYDCCNLTEEVQRRAKPSTVTSFTVAQTLDDILRSHSPLVLGYSGWEDDVFMSSLKRRLSTGLRTNLYWFCFRKAEVDSLPNWLQSQADICAVVPAEVSSTVAARTTAEGSRKTSLGALEELSGEPSSSVPASSKVVEPVLTATAVFDEFIRTFEVHQPNLTKDPLGFFAEQLRSSLLGDRPDELENDVYSIRGVIDRVLKAKDIQQAAPPSELERHLEILRNASRHSDYRAAVHLGEAIPKRELSIPQLREVMLAMVQAGAALWDNSEEEIRSYDLVVALADRLAELGAADATALTDAAKALYNKALTLGALRRTHEEIGIYDDVVRRFADSSELPLQELVAKALFNQGARLAALNRGEEAIAAYNEVVRRFGDSSAMALQEQVANVLVNKGFRLGSMNRNEEAIAVYDEVVRRFGDSSAMALQEQVAKSLFNKGYRLGTLNRCEGEIANYDEVIRRFGDSSATGLQEQVANALVNKGFRLGSMNRSEESIVIYDEVIRRFGDSSATGLQEQVAKALFNKGVRLSALNRSEEAITAYDDVVRLFGDSSEAGLREDVADALLNKAFQVGALNRSEEALAAYDDVVRRFGDSTETYLQQRVAKALVNKGVRLSALNRAEEEMAIYDDVVRRFGDSSETSLREQVAKALVYKAITLGTLNRHGDAAAVYEDVVGRFGSSVDPALQELVNRARKAKSASA